MNERKRRRPVVQTHRARPTSTQRPAEGTDNEMDEEIEREHRKKIMDFIYRLMQGMNMESLERIMDKAIDEIT